MPFKEKTFNHENANISWLISQRNQKHKCIFYIKFRGGNHLKKKLWDPSTKHKSLLSPTGMVWNPHLIVNETPVCTEL